MAARIPTPRQSKPSGQKNATHLPRPYKHRNYYTPEEVSKHSTADDCWVSFNSEVYDLTKLIQKNIAKCWDAKEQEEEDNSNKSLHAFTPPSQFISR